MTLMKVIDRITRHRPGSFVCPIFDADVTEVSVMIDSIPYRFNVSEVEPGWWVMRHKGNRALYDQSIAVVEREAYPSEYLPFLEALPRFYVITLYRLSPHTWLTVPFSMADAEQRGWEKGTPRPMHLVSDSIHPLGMAECRLLDNTMIYAGLAMCSSPPNYRNAVLIVRRREEELRRREIETRRIARQATLRGRLELQLELANARLVNWSEAGEDISVTWEHGGRRHSMRVERSGRIRSSGVCLSGGDGDYNLSAIVGVMEERDNYDDF